MVPRLLIGLVVIGLAACESTSTRSTYDPGADFSGYRTYTWVTDELMVQPREATDPTVSPLVQQRIHDAIDRALQAKGFVEDKTSPDFGVAFTVGLRDKVRVDHWGPYGGFYRPYGVYGGAGRYGGGSGVGIGVGGGGVGFGVGGGGVGYSRSTATNYTEGTLAIDVFDAQTQKPVWNGRATKIVDESDDRPEEIQETVNSALADFPPE